MLQPLHVASADTHPAVTSDNATSHEAPSVGAPLTVHSVSQPSDLEGGSY